ncbi:glutathione transferase [Aulographum hederae CBS 113979]|uniref:Glutathione transferase n=1 Tax=Aulographum hederae CBS 113979 TaxID=1176131 RepID=A0A6G1GKF2_9PEZI|nr:glutathione transferase [Aulographum hederae CBS 113979]
MATEEKKPTDLFTNLASPDGHFRRKPSTFRHTISHDSPFPPERGRYALYFNYGCPWAHRTLITRSLKGLEEVVEAVEVDGMDKAVGKGWFFEGTTGPTSDPLHEGVKYLRELYEMAEPGFEGRVTVPVLWDKKTETIVNNESSEIIRIFCSAFDEFLPVEKREVSKGAAALLPSHLEKEIDEMNAWIYETVNNGVYKAGFATTQEAYEGAVYPLFESLDRVEKILGKEGHGPFLFGEHITDADIRLFTTIARFDVGYYTMFKCNLKMIRHDYPRIHDWFRKLYWDEGDLTNGGAFRKTTNLEISKRGYAGAARMTVVPVGPVPDVLPL